MYIILKKTEDGNYLCSRVPYLHPNYREAFIEAQRLANTLKGEYEVVRAMGSYKTEEKKYAAVFD